MNLLSTFFSKIKLLFSDKKCLSTKTSNKLSKLDHSCALVALSRVFPHLTYNLIEEAFYNCCEEWPNQGVTHKEFNIVLNYLNISDSFIYKECTSNIFSDFIKNKNPIILLIPGHYTVCYKGRIYDSYGYSSLNKQTKIYCYWLLK